MREFTFIWFIQNYSYNWHKEFQVLESPTFKVEMMQKSSWKLVLYPRGKKDKDFISLLLKRCGNYTQSGNLTLNCKLSILDAKGRDLVSDEIKDEECGNCEVFGKSNFLERLENILKNRTFTLDVLRVCCKMWVGEGEVEEETLCYAKTRIALEKISFITTIESFSTLNTNEKILFDVTSVSKDSLEIFGNLYVKSEPDSDDKVVVEISHESQNTHLMSCQIYIVNTTGKEVECGRIDLRNDVRWDPTLSSPTDFGRKNLLEKKLEYLPNDKLTLRCECTLSTGIEFQRIEETFHNLHLTPLLKEKFRATIFTLPTAEPKSVSGDFRSLYMDKILSDIQFQSKNNIFYAHKFVLCARSPVLARLLRTNAKEKLVDCFKIEDLENSTIDQFLIFLYTDTLEDLQWESAKKLYCAAGKYQVQRLKDVCTSFLIAGINRYNMHEVLILADTHKDSNLKTAIEKFIIKRDRKIFFEENWKEFMKEHQKLAMEAMHFYLKNKK